jgi:4'-phosphopantetheinyl transferase
VHRERDRRRATLRRAVLRQLLGGYLDIPPADVHLETGEHGKPSCTAAGSLGFNCSSSHGLAVFAFAADGRIGVDVEYRPDAVWEDFPIRKYLSDRERERLSELPPRLARRRAAEAWVTKEALVKAIGSGLSLPPTQLELEGDPERPRVRWSDDWASQSSAEWRVRVVDADRRRIAAVALDTDHSHTVARFWNPERREESPLGSPAAVGVT